MKTYTIKEILNNRRIIIFIENKEQFNRLSNIKELRLTDYYMGSYCYNPRTGSWSSSSTKTYPGAFDSGSIIITSEQIIENIPEKEENKPKLEVGKWYSFDWYWHGPKSTIIAKIKEVNENSFAISWRSCLWRKNDYSTSDRYDFRDASNIKELSLEEVQQYLPEGHPDKIKPNENFQVGDWVIAIGNIIEYENPTIGKLEKFSKENYESRVSFYGETRYLSIWSNIIRHATPEEIHRHLVFTGQIQQYFPDGHPDKFREVVFKSDVEHPITPDKTLISPEKMEKTSRNDLITRAVKTNNPQLIADELGYTIEEIIKSENSTTYSCVTNNFKLLRGAISCSRLRCTDDKCPFYNSNEKAISWLRGESKSVSPPESELERWLRKTKAKNLSLEELEHKINYEVSYYEVYKKLQGDCAKDKAQILYNEWNVKQEKDWTKLTKGELLKEAKKRYPKGTKFRSAVSNNVYVSDGDAASLPGSFYPDGIANYLGLGLFYANGKWAEIVPEPEEVFHPSTEQKESSWLNVQEYRTLEPLKGEQIQAFCRDIFIPKEPKQNKEDEEFLNYLPEPD